MSHRQISFRDRLQLRLLRLLSISLALIDRLLGVRWGEHLLERLAARWQARLAQIDAELAALEREREMVRLQAEGLALYTAVTFLAGRQLARGELRFDSADPNDEEVLQANIDLLVKERLAGVDVQEIEPGHYLYHLEPDWARIQTRLEEAATHAGPEAAGWLREGSRLAKEFL
jgi:hypothetical protein